jgi:uncharacterized DUF497 family protein
MGLQELLMDISFSPEKRADTLAERGLDFQDAALVFSGKTAAIQDILIAYGEDCFITAGFLRGRCIAMVRTPRGNSRHIISMRYTHAAEEKRWFA